MYKIVKANSNSILLAKQVLIQEVKGLTALHAVIETDLEFIVNIIMKLSGKLIFSGMGKSGHIARKIAATFSSMGVSSFFLHPAEASHGDIGAVSKNDLVVVLSNSGDTQELIPMLRYCQNNNISTLGITRSKGSVLHSMASNCVVLPYISESSEINMPTTSIIMVLAFWDCIAVVVQKSKRFGIKEFERLHPGGTIGACLMPISKLMHQQSYIPKILDTAQGKEIVIEMIQKGFGCVAVVNATQQLVGVISYCDLSRNFNSDLNKIVARRIMTVNPLVLSEDALVVDVIRGMHSKDVTVMFVVSHGKPTGIVHIRDLIKVGGREIYTQ